MCRVSMLASRFALSRLVASGYSSSLLASVLANVLFNFGSVAVPRKKPEKKVCLPFFHLFSHNLHTLAESHGVNVVFKNDFKLGKLTPSSGDKHGSPKSHRDPVNNCEMAV